MRSLLLFLLLAAAPLGGQALDGAVFIENVHSEITTQTGSAARRRVVDRMAQFDMQQHGDTLIVTADTVHLIEAADASV